MDKNSSEAEDELPALQSSQANLHDAEPKLLSDEETTHVYTPPAHIAARFYRSNSNRRRSSAASSRRNSLSSSHSHHSNRSYRGIHTTHVAQHLRRASIIETRKARLADRAAHAEQVRLRAALAKATPRKGLTEEKALAAQQARDRLLAKVAASCAEEVARAKKVAEETREKKAAEERRYRLEVEEKHAEAERRRCELRRAARKSRSTSTAAFEGKVRLDIQLHVLSRERAVQRIQRAWRGARGLIRIKAFTKLGLTIDRIRELDFTSSTALLADAELLARTTALIKHLELEASADVDQVIVRRFLSAYMILGHATDVFNQPGEQADDLMQKAKELLISFEAILSDMSSVADKSVLASDRHRLSSAYGAYVSAFEAWKSKDASVLIETMVDQFVALDAIWQTVKDETRGEVANDYSDAIREQQILLYGKIKKVAGAEAANSRIKMGIREGRRARSSRNRTPLADLRPRPAPVTNTIPFDAEPAEECSSGPTWSQTELSRVFSVVPPNRTLVHELMIDPGYRIESSPGSDNRGAFNREVCNNMRQAIHAGQGTEWTVAVADSIRTRLLRLLKPETPMHSMLSEVLETDHIRTQCESGLFSYAKFFAFMADLLPKLCAPFRDAEVRELIQVLQRSGDSVDESIEALFGLLHVIDFMVLDYSQYLLTQAAPTLIREGPAYEERHFAADLESGRVSLNRTKRWWRYTSLSLVTETASLNTPLALLIPSVLSQDNSQHTAFVRIYAQGLTDLLLTSNASSEHDIPETLKHDTGRFVRLRKTIGHYATASAITLTAKNLLRRDVRSQWKPEARRIVEALSATQGESNEDPSSGETSMSNLTARILAIIEAAHGMPPTSRTHLERATNRSLREAASTATTTDPVMKLLRQRIRVCIFAQLAAAIAQGVTSTEQVRLSSSVSEVLSSAGLVEFVPGLASVAEEMQKVASVDLRSHGRWYAEVAREVDGTEGHS